jgi:hypothetical protein
MAISLLFSRIFPFPVRTSQDLYSHKMLYFRISFLCNFRTVNYTLPCPR